MKLKPEIHLDVPFGVQFYEVVKFAYNVSKKTNEVVKFKFNGCTFSVDHNLYQTEDEAKWAIWEEYIRT